MNYEEALQFIHSTYRFGSKLGLERIKRLMYLLETPEYLQNNPCGRNKRQGVNLQPDSDVLMEAGYKTGLFISPYLEEFTERIQINKHHINKDSLARITALVNDKVSLMLSEGYDHPTEFEIVTAIGFKYFQEENIDFWSLKWDWEAGLMQPM